MPRISKATWKVTKNSRKQKIEEYNLIQLVFTAETAKWTYSISLDVWVSRLSNKCKQFIKYARTLNRLENKKNT